MEVGRGHETPKSEMKDFITEINSRSQRISICFGFARHKYHRAMYGALDDTCTYDGVGYRRNSELGHLNILK